MGANNTFLTSTFLRTQQTKSMHKNESLYLDFIRFSAALLVFLFHAKYPRFDGRWLSEVGKYGHDAVIMFFVLSGYVIAFVVNNKEKDFSDYLINRLARLYSVVVPALVLTLICDYLGKRIDPSLYSGAHYQASMPVIRFLANLFFINEIWFSSWRPFSNGPFWSLCYEFWYYFFFGCVFYVKSGWRFVASASAILIAGPKIVILLPVWLLGVGVYYLGKRINVSIFWGTVLFIVPILAYWIYRDLGTSSHLLDETIRRFGRSFVYDDLRWSRRFVNDYVVGLLFSLHVLGSLALARRLRPVGILEKPLRYFAGCTFSLYLFHYPLLQFFAALFDNGPITVGCTFLSVLLLAPLTEGKKSELKLLMQRSINSFRVPTSLPPAGQE